MLKKTLKILSYFISIFIIVHLFRKNGSAEVLDIISYSSLNWVLMCVLFSFVSIVLGSLQWFFLLKIQKGNISIFQCFKLYYLGLFFNATFNSIAGEASKVYKLKKAGYNYSLGVASTLTDRILGLLSLMFFCVVSCIWLMFQGKNIPYFNIILIYSISILGFILLAFLINRKLLLKWVSDLINKISFFGFLKPAYQQLLIVMQQYQNNSKSFIFLFFLSLLTQSIRILGHYFISLAIGIDISPIYFFCFIPIISLFLILPFNIGGWGLPQAVAIEVYKLPEVIQSNHENINSLITTLAFLPVFVFYTLTLIGVFFLFTKAKQNN